MRKIFIPLAGIAAIFTGFVAGGVEAQPGPSFKCKTYQGVTEDAICGNRRLASLDREMAGLYFELKELLTNASKRDLLQDQRDWIKRRNACKRDTGCYFELYYERIDFFNGILDESRLAYVDPEPDTQASQPRVESQQPNAIANGPAEDLEDVFVYPAAGMSLGANLRAGPGTKNAQIGKVVDGEPLIILDRTEVEGGGYSWYYVMGSNGAKGYIWGGLLCNFYDESDGKGCAQ